MKSISIAHQLILVAGETNCKLFCGWFEEVLPMKLIEKVRLDESTVHKGNYFHEIAR